MPALSLSHRDLGRGRVARRFSNARFDLSCLVYAIGAGALPLSALVPWALRQAWLVVFRGSNA
jgi:hypothetical protein